MNRLRICCLAAMICFTQTAAIAGSVADDKGPSAGIASLRTQAEQGNPEAQYDFAIALCCGHGMRRDQKEANKWFLRAALQGHSRAQSALGWRYMTGRGVARDNAEAVKWLRKAAEQGDTSAQNNLGLAYATGSGVARDEGEARKWFRKAADQGAEEALQNLERLERDSTNRIKTMPPAKQGETMD